VFAGTVGASTPGGYGVANASVAAVLAQAHAHQRAGLQVSTEGCAGG
jgi:hypothetical protein